MGGSCDPHAEQPSTFVDATADWGLSGVAMNNVDTVDLDHDGYPDLIVFSGNADQREVIPSFWDGGFHNQPDGGFLWDVGVLMNRPQVRRRPDVRRRDGPERPVPPATAPRPNTAWRSWRRWPT